jgi:hypothetical protein
MYHEDDGTNYEMYLKLVEQDRQALTDQDDYLTPEYPLICELFDRTEALWKERAQKAGTTSREPVGAAAVNWPFRS